MNFITNEETADLPTTLLLEIIVIVFSLSPSLPPESVFENILFHIGLHRDHVRDLHLHLDDLLIMYNQSPLKIMTTTLKTFPSRKTNLKLLCIPLK